MSAAAKLPIMTNVPSAPAYCIAPPGVAAFIVAQLIGALAAVALARWLWPFPGKETEVSRANARGARRGCAPECDDALTGPFDKPLDLLAFS
jgi:glycerol uptake facilitator-like aquaporin